MLAKAVEFGHLQPLDDLIDLSQYQDQFSSLQNLSVRDGKTYGFVTEGVVYELLYNPELFEQAGLDPEKPPTTVDEFLDACQKVKTLGADILGYGVRNSLDQSGGWWYDYAAWAYGHGARWAVDGKPTINSPENLKALQEFKRVYDSGCMSQGLTSATYRNAFGLGKVGMLTDVSAMINIYKNDAPDLDVRTGRLPFPAPMTAAEVLFVGTSADSEHQAEAAKFIEWFMQPEVYQKWLETILSPTGGLKEGVSQEWIDANSWAQPFIEGANEGALGVTPEGLEAMTNEISKIVLTQIESVLVAGADPQEALDKAQAEVEALVARSQ
jgi:multiple sugar transport system substrate-binding protein